MTMKNINITCVTSITSMIAATILSLGATPAHAAAIAPAVVRAAVTLDPADSLYKAAHAALADGDYSRAVQLFRRVETDFPQSALVPDAMYYEAFARYRSGNSDDLMAARDVLATLARQYPAYVRKSDASSLSMRICGELAQRGDASCAASIAREASKVVPTIAPSRDGDGYEVGVRRTSTPDGCPNSDDDDRVAALNALLQMDADRAEPILEKVIARRDPCSAPLRQKAMFLVSQKRTPQTVDILLHAAQTDPDPEVRAQAVFWLSQVPGDRTVSVLQDIITKSTDPALRDKAIFALSQNNSPQARTIMREYALNESAPPESRARAIFWLGQKDGAENGAFLKSMYDKFSNERLKEAVMLALSQRRDPGNAAWLLSIAQNQRENIDARKRALFFAGQSGGMSVAQLSQLYDSMQDDALREQVIFVLAQSRDPAAVDKLMSIARSDKDPAARKRAIFWLGQSHDPRATQFLQELVSQ